MRHSGAPDGWEPPGPPPTFLGYVPKFDAPKTFEEVDNPAGWDAWMFDAVYKNKKYSHHETPSGAKVVTANAVGVREVNGWNFHYNGWEADDFDKQTYVRGNAKRGDIKSKDRKGCLDVQTLKKHGVCPKTLKDPLFILQLLLPIHDPRRTGIENDGRMPYFTEARAHTNSYAVSTKGWGGMYGHTADSQLVSEAELVRWTAVPILNGAREGKPGSLHRRWMKNDKEFDEHVAESMTMTRFREIKSVFKLNNNWTTPERGSPGYDPCNKYDYIFKTVCHNMNYLTEEAEADCALDESTWGFSGYCGDTGGRLMNKPIGKGT